MFTYGVVTTDLSSLFAADDWIYIESGRWSGLHQVKSTGSATGILTLKTKCNLKPSKISVVGSFATNETFNGDNAAADKDIESFKDDQSYLDTPYVFVDQSASDANAGLFSLSKDTTVGQLSFVNKITIDADGDYESSAAAILAVAGDTVDLYNAAYEQISVYKNIEVMEDETFEIDISRTQAEAVIYYLKARLAEDMLDMKSREFFMRLFKKQVDKFQGAQKAGPYIVQSHWSMR